MKSRMMFAVMLGFLVMFGFSVLGGEHPEHPAKKKKEKAAEPAKHEISTADIATGIEKHIADKTKAGGGKFSVVDGDKTLSLTLTKIHNDKLANLGDGSYFACVDFKGDDGNTYDVDFFLKGESGAMLVTETTVHKVNGTPRYNWKQEADGKWTKVSLNK